MLVERGTGLEPATSSFARKRSTNWANHALRTLKNKGLFEVHNIFDLIYFLAKGMIIEQQSHLNVAIDFSWTPHTSRGLRVAKIMFEHDISLHITTQWNFFNFEHNATLILSAVLWELYSYTAPQSNSKLTSRMPKLKNFWVPNRSTN